MAQIAQEINATRTQGDLILVPGDVLSVQFPRQDSWNQDDLTVTPDGTITLLELDSIKVSGLTLEQLDQKLTEQYSKILARPDLTVKTTQVAPRTVIVMGEVKSGGSFGLPAGELSLLEAFGLAEGHIRDTAQLDHTLLVRWMPETGKTKAWKIDASVGEWDADEPIFLQAHDVIFVPAKPVVHVNDWVDRYIRQNLPLPFITLAQ